ncbi:30S ribosomal protein S27ae [Candidatus Woesearchaeota archaeon]|nr:30S ribosomal protein S27ae [Candidatus Woesearchaeota archaeon]
MADKKATKKKKPAYTYASNYEVAGSNLKRKGKSCPKCGSGVFMADHKDRWTCGKCGYMEKRAKKE